MPLNNLGKDKKAAGKPRISVAPVEEMLLEVAVELLEVAVPRRAGEVVAVVVLRAAAVVAARQAVAVRW